MNRYTYLPYLYTVMQESTRLGTPVIRPLFYHYINDSAVYSDQQNYLVGRDLLILPVTQPELRFMKYKMALLLYSIVFIFLMMIGTISWTIVLFMERVF